MVYEVKDEEERVILVSVCLSDEEETKESLDELEELAKTAGAVTVFRMYQNRETIHPGTYIGKGKIEELKECIRLYNANGIVCDDELSPAQIKNLEEELNIKVIDRTVMILDIFAQHASTKEGKIQVELAQLKYRSSRLIGLGNSLSRLGGGIGTRGPGEKKLEMDRRIIRDRISQLNKELEQVKKNRDTLRKQRLKSMVPVIAIVGYTNAGKSTLLNKLTNAGVLEEDKLFATLDPTTRSLELDSGQKILMTDTVGFIKKLPHHLINAFRSTLEEARYADMILHVVDSSNPACQSQINTVYETLNHLDIKDKPCITAFNKLDKVEEEFAMKDSHANSIVRISAKEGINLDKLLDTIDRLLRERKVFFEKTFSYHQAGEIQQIRKYGQLLEEKYTENGIYVKAYVPGDIFQKINCMHNI